MGKIINLTEADIVEIVKQVIREQVNEIDFSKWTNAEKLFYEKMISKMTQDEFDDEFGGYTSEEIHDRIKTKMSAQLDRDKAAKGFIQHGSDPAYMSRSKLENAGEANDQTWFDKFPCIPKTDYKIEFSGTPAVRDLTLGSHGIQTLYFHDGSLIVVQQSAAPITKFWYCNGTKMEFSNDSIYNLWVPKTDPRSLAEKFATHVKQ